MMIILSFVLDSCFASKVTPDAIRPESISKNFSDVTTNFFIASLYWFVHWLFEHCLK